MIKVSERQFNVIMVFAVVLFQVAIWAIGIATLGPPPYADLGDALVMTAGSFFGCYMPVFLVIQIFDEIDEQREAYERMMSARVENEEHKRMIEEWEWRERP